MRGLKYAGAAGMLALLVGAGVVLAEEDEEAVAIADLPAAVVEAIEAEYPGAKLLEAEKETEEGRTLSEVEIEFEGEELEVELTPDGLIVEVEAEGDDPKDGEED